MGLPVALEPARRQPTRNQRWYAAFSLLDSVLLLVGGIIGSSIFLTAKDIAGPLPHPLLFLLVWVLGAVHFSLACFAFAELGSMFPDSGGQYVYLREAYGDLPAFLYGWMLFSRGQRRHHRGAFGGLFGISGWNLSRNFPGARVFSAVRNRSDSRSCRCADGDCRGHLDQRHRAAPGRDAAKCSPPGRSSPPWRHS